MPRTDPTNPATEGARRPLTKTAGGASALGGALATAGAIAIGGSLGALMRFGLTRLLSAPTEVAPWVATAVLNVLGALVLGFLLARLDEHAHPLLRPFLATGFLGSFTTFSALLLQNSAFLGTSPLHALLHLVLAIGLGLAAFPVGEALGRQWPGRASA